MLPLSQQYQAREIITQPVVAPAGVSIWNGALDVLHRDTLTDIGALFRGSVLDDSEYGCLPSVNQGGRELGHQVVLGMEDRCPTRGIPGDMDPRQ